MPHYYLHTFHKTDCDDTFLGTTILG